MRGSVTRNCVNSCAWAQSTSSRRPSTVSDHADADSRHNRAENPIFAGGKSISGATLQGNRSSRQLAASQTPESRANISAEIKKEEDQPVNITAGLQYKFLPQLLTRIGISATTSSVWIGIGIILPAIQLDITTAYHPQLGISPGLLVLFNLDNK